MKKVIAIFMLVLIMMSMMTVVSFATETSGAGAGTTASASSGDDDVFDKAETIFEKVRQKIMGIASAAAGVGLVISLCMWGAGNTKHSQAGWDWAKRIVIAYIAIMSITLILGTINSLAGIK